MYFKSPEGKKYLRMLQVHVGENVYFLYHAYCVRIYLIRFCNCNVPYIRASAEGGQPEITNMCALLAMTTSRTARTYQHQIPLLTTN